MTKQKNHMTEKLMYFIDPMVRDIKGVIPMIARLRYQEGKRGNAVIEFFRTDWNWGNDMDIAKSCVRKKNKLIEADTDDITIDFPHDLSRRAIY